MQLISSCSFLLGLYVASNFIKEREYRHIFFLANLVHLVYLSLQLLFSLRINLQYNIPDLVMISLMAFFSYFSKSFMIMSGPVMFMKLSPHHVEASTFALYAGIYHFSVEFARDIIGSFIARKMNVTNQNLKDYYILVTISLACALVAFIYVFLVPKRVDVDRLAKQFR